MRGRGWSNHAELAGHDFHHELETAAAMGLFGSVDANRGALRDDSHNGWDTDQFPMSYYETTLARDYGTVGIASGKQERLENLVNQYLMGL